MKIKWYCCTFLICCICIGVWVRPVVAQEHAALMPRVLNAGDSLLIKELYLQGVQQKASGQLTAAERTFDKVILLQPDNHAAYFELARIHFEKEDYASAEKSAVQATKLDPDNKWYWTVLLDVYKKTANFKKIAGVFGELIRLDPQKESNYYDKAYALYLDKQYDAALTAYDEIAGKFGKTEDLYIIRHQVYLAKGDRRSATAELEALIATKPANSKGYVLLADLYTGDDNAKKALALLDDAGKTFPDDPLILLAKSDASLAMGRQKQAYSLLQQAFSSDALDIDTKAGVLYTAASNPKRSPGAEALTGLADLLVEVYPRETKAHAVRGDIYLQMGQPEKAREAYLKALDINRYIEGIWPQLLQTELQLGRYDDVATHGKEALSLFPNNTLLLFFTGHGFLGSKRYEEARSYFETALNSADEGNVPLLTQLYSNLGDIYHALDMYAESDVAYEEAIATDSTNAYALNNYAYYLALRKENLHRAAEMSKKSNELEPDFASYEDTYAWVLFQQGDYEAALTWIKKAIGHSDTISDTLLEHYGDILSRSGDIQGAVIQWKKARDVAKALGKDIDKLTKKINERQYVE